MSRAVGCLILLLSLGAAPALGQGKLERVRDAVNGEDEEEPEKKEDRDREPCWCGHDDHEDDSTVTGEFFGLVIASPFVLPHLAMHDDLDRYGYFPNFPYAWEREGYVWADPPPKNQGLRWWAGRFSLENGNDFDGLNQVNGHLLLETASRFGIQSRLQYLEEDLPARARDELYLGSTELTYRFAQCEKAQMYAGIGFRFLDDCRDTDFGFNFTYGGDFFPAKPFIVSFLLDAGNLGDAGVFHGRITGGVLYKGFEIYTGYDYLNIGSVSLHALLGGLRLWF